jgi:acetolactate synthase-1/3 small subunit
MKKDFTLEDIAENSFGILNRMINTFNRRRIRIKSLAAYEMEENHRAGAAKFILYATEETVRKAQLQIEKFIEVERTVLHEGAEKYDLVGE